jgi:peptidoglycan/LPS O-acetylase OafA/YrhL
VANWHAIFSHQSYFTQFSTPSPLTHTWSLAIEEQFYLLWPLVIVALLRWSPRRWRAVGLGLCVVGAGASMLAMAVLYRPGVDPSRIYYGTDTRAFDLLVGAALAFVAAARPQPGPRARAALHRVAPVALVALLVLWATAGTSAGLPRSWMFEGAFLACAVLAGLVIADVRQLDRGPVAQVLSLGPLRWIGTISYGLYLWHWPVIVYLNHPRTGLDGAGLDLARLGLTFALATASYYLVERPVRRASFAGLRTRLAVPGAVIATVAVIVAGTTPSLAAPVRAWAGGGLDPGSGPQVAGAGGYGGEVPITLPPGLTVSPQHPLRVLTFGDSVMTFAQFGIRAALERTQDAYVFPAAQTGWRLTLPGDGQFVDRYIGLVRPQLLIGTWSWDSVAAETHPAAYRQTLDGALRRWLTPGDGVLGVILLQMPALRPLPRVSTASPSYRADLARRAAIPGWNAAARQAAGRFPGKVMYLPVASSLDLNGRYTSWLPSNDNPSEPRKSWVRVRTSDGVHICPAGITRYTAPLLEDMRELFRLPPAPGHWWNGYLITVQSLRWQNSSLAVTCPADHPPQ